MQKIGILGAGNISKIYLTNLTGMFGNKVKLTAITDIDIEKAQKAAAEFSIKAFNSLDEMLNNADIDIVLNITPPKAHYQTALTAVKAGKHVYNEKPISTKRKEAAALLKIAAKKGVRIGGAPDTFLGAGLQTCRKVIDDGMIGTPVAANAAIMGHGPEHWHPSPQFFYKDGGGPMFDMGPYYLTALISLLGPVARVSGSARISIPTRTITNQYQNGEIINVEVPTHIAGVLDFASGVIVSLTTSFDIYSHSLPYIEIYGTEGTLQLPDPNFFNGPVLVRRFREEKWEEIPLVSNFTDNCRGFGITEMAQAIEENRPHRACSDLTFHVLDIMQGIHEASLAEKYVKLASNCKRPEAL